MTIKETAGKVLLYFYKLQRATPLSVPNRQVGFVVKKEGGLGLTSDKVWLTKDLQGINPSSGDILNAFIYLLDNKYIQAGERTASSARIYVGVRLTSNGIDVVEGIERDRDGKHNFEVAFNIKVEGDLDVEGLTKENLTMLAD